jgi:2-hydroxy-6-oxonona-2,4-dienedioate hydrolase
MSGIKFCNECLNILVPRETKGDKGLSFECRSCDYSEPCRDPNSMDEHRISQRNFVQAMTEDLIHDDYCFDPTMPQEKVICPYCRYCKAVYVISREPNDKYLKKTYICMNPDCKKKYTTLNYIKLAEAKPDTYAYREVFPNLEENLMDDSGDIPILILLHGLYTNSYLFERVLPMLSKRFRVIAPDLRGFGFSSYSNDIKKVDDFAVDLNNLLQKLKIQRCSIVGWDLGCLIALKFAAMQPNINLQKMVLVNPLSLSGKIYKWDPNTEMPTLEWPETVEELDKDPSFNKLRQAFGKRDKNFLTKFLVEEVLPTTGILTEEELETYVEHFYIQPKGYDQVMKSLYSFEFNENLKDKLNIETHLVIGGLDQKCPEAEVNEIRDILGDNCKLKKFEDCGHNIILENPDDFVSLIESACGL